MEEIKKADPNKIQKIYAPPAIECISICVENGFAVSPGETPVPDDNDLGEL